MFRVCAPGRDTFGGGGLRRWERGSNPKVTHHKKKGAIKGRGNYVHTDKARSLKFPTCERMTEARVPELADETKTEVGGAGSGHVLVA